MKSIFLMLPVLAALAGCGPSPAAARWPSFRDELAHVDAESAAVLEAKVAQSAIDTGVPALSQRLIDRRGLRLIHINTGVASGFDAVNRRLDPDRRDWAAQYVGSTVTVVGLRGNELTVVTNVGISDPAEYAEPSLTSNSGKAAYAVQVMLRDEEWARVLELIERASLAGSGMKTSVGSFDGTTLDLTLARDDAGRIARGIVVNSMASSLEPATLIGSGAEDGIDAVNDLLNFVFERMFP